MRFDQIQMPVFFFFIQNKKKKSKKRHLMYIFYLQENVQFVTWVTSAKFSDFILFDSIVS